MDKSHPVSNQCKEWIDSGRSLARHSLFLRAFALCSSFYRYAGFSHSLEKATEPLSNRTRRLGRGETKPRLSKAQAKLEHRQLCSVIETNDNILRIYTDGSAIPNPGHIGMGVCLIAPNFKRTISEPLGFGSNISAELCALRAALRQAISLARRYKKFYIFSDCFIAVKWANSESHPSSDYRIVSDIRQLLHNLRQHSDVCISWVPAHVGVPGNETANTAAQRGAEDVSPGSKYNDEPLVPFRVARATLKRGIRECWQEQWLKNSLHRFEHDHLSRIKLGVARNKFFEKGDRAEQTVLARLRLGHC